MVGQLGFFVHTFTNFIQFSVTILLIELVLLKNYTCSVKNHRQFVWNKMLSDIALISPRQSKSKALRQTLRRKCLPLISVDCPTVKWRCSLSSSGYPLVPVRLHFNSIYSILVLLKFRLTISTMHTENKIQVGKRAGFHWSVLVPFHYQLFQRRLPDIR